MTTRTSVKTLRPRRFTPRSRSAWRSWLQKNHTGVEEVWVVFYRKGTGHPTVSYNDAVEEALCFGWIDGIRKRVDSARYMHRFTPRRLNSAWSKSNKERVARLIEARLMTPAGQRLIDHAKRGGAWSRSSDLVPVPDMPDELTAALDADQDALVNFNALAPSYRRQFIAWIADAKRPTTRAGRVAKSVDLLRRGERLGMA